MNIQRDLEAAQAAEYDLIVVGGGVHGAMTTLEASRRGYRALLLERDDFGGATSGNSLRIVHGGLRYLQTLDLARFRESVVERRWFLRRFPDLVRPLRCVMPLYGRGPRRPSVLRVALALNDVLARRVGGAASPQPELPAGRVLDPAETMRLAPSIRAQGLLGAAEWWDASIEDAARLLMEVLRWAVASGATCLNYVEATEVVSDGGRAAGVVAADRLQGAELRFRAPLVVDCTGPEAGRLAGGPPPSFFVPSLAFNLLIDRPSPSDAALAVMPPHGGPTYFLRPCNGLLLAGTYHAPRLPNVREARVSSDEINRFLRDLEAALPGSGLGPDRVLRVMAGLLPARRSGGVRLANRPRIRDEGRHGGTRGLVSVAGIKYTTSRAVADRVLRRLFGRQLRPRRPVGRPEPAPRLSPGELASLRQADPEAAAGLVARIAEEESVHAVEDLLHRRTDWGTNPADEAALRPWLEPILQARMARDPVPTTTNGGSGGEHGG